MENERPKFVPSAEMQDAARIKLAKSFKFMVQGYFGYAFAVAVYYSSKNADAGPVLKTSAFTAGFFGTVKALEVIKKRIENDWSGEEWED